MTQAAEASQVITNIQAIAAKAQAYDTLCAALFGGLPANKWLRLSMSIKLNDSGQVLIANQTVTEPVAHTAEPQIDQIAKLTQDRDEVRAALDRVMHDVDKLKQANDRGDVVVPDGFKLVPFDPPLCVFQRALRLSPLKSYVAVQKRSDWNRVLQALPTIRLKRAPAGPAIPFKLVAEFLEALDGWIKADERETWTAGYKIQITMITRLMARRRVHEARTALEGELFAQQTTVCK